MLKVLIITALNFVRCWQTAVTGLSRRQVGSTLKYHFSPKKKIRTKCILWELDDVHILAANSLSEIVGTFYEHS